MPRKPSGKSPAKPSGKPSGKPKHNIFTDPSAYGTYQGPHGSAASWKRAFAEAETFEGATAIIEDDSPWGILGLSPGATMQEAKSRYKALMLENHPDRGGNTEKCTKIIAAWTIIKESFA